MGIAVQNKKHKSTHGEGTEIHLYGSRAKAGMIVLIVGHALLAREVERTYLTGVFTWRTLFYRPLDFISAPPLLSAFCVDFPEAYRSVFLMRNLEPK
jgi:hypothetical protein